MVAGFIEITETKESSVAAGLFELASVPERAESL
jgi:hypothetical protein